MAKRRTKWKTKIKRAAKTAWRRRKAARAKAKTAAAKAAKTGQPVKGRPIKVTVEPTGGPTTRRDLWRIVAHQKVASFRTKITEPSTPERRGAVADVRDLEQLRQRAKRRRLDRRHQFTCAAHTPPQHFASSADLNQHFTEDHSEPVQHPRGTVAQPKPRRMPQPTKPNRPPSGPRPRVKPMPKSKGDAAELGTDLRLIKFYVDRVREEAIKVMGATNAVATLGDIGSMPISTVSQIQGAAVALEGIAQALEEAVTGFRDNCRRSEQAPVKEEVLVFLNPLIDNAQAMAVAAIKFLSAFDDEYGPDMRAAKAGERMDNAALNN